MTGIRGGRAAPPFGQPGRAPLALCPQLGSPCTSALSQARQQAGATNDQCDGFCVGSRSFLTFWFWVFFAPLSACPSSCYPGLSASTSSLRSLGRCLSRWWSTEQTPCCTRTTFLRSSRVSPTSAACDTQGSRRALGRKRPGPPALVMRWR